MENQEHTAIETAIFGGGCFWCLEPVFRALDGVQDVRPGYCGGHVDHPTVWAWCAWPEKP